MTYLNFSLNLGELTEEILSSNQKALKKIAKPYFPRKRFDFSQTCTV